METFIFHHLRFFALSMDRSFAIICILSTEEHREHQEMDKLSINITEMNSHEKNVCNKKRM